MVKNLVLGEDLGDRLVRRSDHQTSAGPAVLIELRPRQGRPAALATDAAHDLGVRTEEGMRSGFGRVGKEAMAIDPDPELIGRDAGAAAGLAVEVRQRSEAPAADDRNRQRQAKRAGPIVVPPDAIQTGSGRCSARG